MRQVTVVCVFEDGKEPDQTEWAEIIEDSWLGTLLEVEAETV